MASTARLTANGRQTGFTYIAMLIGVAIIGATLASVGQVWHTTIQREHEKELLFVGNQFRTALARYFAANRRYPLQLEELLEDTSAAKKRYLRKIFIDPMTGKNVWGLIKLDNGQIVGIHSLSDEQPLKIAGFRQKDVELEKKEKYSEWEFSATVKGLVNPTVTPGPQKPSSPTTKPSGFSVSPAQSQSRPTFMGR